MIIINHVYIQGDITKREDVEAVFRQIKKQYGRLNGIIHSAGLLRDNFIVRKSRSEFFEVLEVKVDGTLHLDEITQKEQLDFFVLFSSGAGVLGNTAQSDYSTANAFLDAFAEHRNKHFNSVQFTYVLLILQVLIRFFRVFNKLKKTHLILSSKR